MSRVLCRCWMMIVWVVAAEAWLLIRCLGWRGHQWPTFDGGFSRLKVSFQVFTMFNDWFQRKLISFSPTQNEQVLALFLSSRNKKYQRINLDMLIHSWDFLGTALALLNCQWYVFVTFLDSWSWTKKNKVLSGHDTPGLSEAIQEILRKARAFDGRRLSPLGHGMSKHSDSYSNIAMPLLKHVRLDLMFLSYQQKSFLVNLSILLEQVHRPTMDQHVDGRCFQGRYLPHVRCKQLWHPHRQWRCFWPR